MEAYFVYNNIKAHPLKFNTGATIPGFRVLSWNSWTYGTLWDIGQDAAYTVVGNGKVFGQLWIPEDYSNLHMLESFCRVDEGLTEPVEIDVAVPVGGVEVEKLSAITYALSEVNTAYKIIQDGKWKF